MLKTDVSCFLATLVAAGMIAIGSSVWAQTDDTASESSDVTEQSETESGTDANADTAEEIPSAPSDIESQLSLGEEGEGGEGLGEAYAKEVIGDWELRCLRTETPEEDPCQMYQLMDDGQGQPVAEFSLFRLPGDGRAEAGATVIVPLETALPNQLTLQIDGGAPKRYPYAFCNQLGCYARIGLTAQDVSAFKRGREAVMTIIPALAPDQEVKLTMSLNGFTATYDKVSVIER